MKTKKMKKNHRCGLLSSSPHLHSPPITALVTFEKGDKVKGKLTFGFEDDQVREKKIESLHIEFL